MVEIIPPEASLGQLVGAHPNVTNEEENQDIGDGDFQHEHLAKCKLVETQFYEGGGKVRNQMAGLKNFCIVSLDLCSEYKALIRLSLC